MKIRSSLMRLFLGLILFMACQNSFPQSKGLKTITEKELKYHLEFLGAREFRGRETPSAELEIATLYLGNWLSNEGLKTIMPDGTFYQDVPLTVTSVFQPHTTITIAERMGEKIYYFGKGFSGSFLNSGNYSGNVVFAGAGIYDPANGWDDLDGLELTGKVVVILDVQHPKSKNALGSTLSNRLNPRISEIRRRGASLVLSVIHPDRQNRLDSGSNVFDYIPTGRLGILYDSQKTDFKSSTGSQQTAFERAEISHDIASDILGITSEEIIAMFEKIGKSQQVRGRDVHGISVRLNVEMVKSSSTSRNVIAMVEGSDAELKNEYVVICGHHDGRGIDDGEIIAGADDNGSGTVGMLEIAQALMAERPKRSVILAWFTGEEQGMNGSHYFINNCPVPLEKISACLNVDMIGRNDPDSLFLVGPELLSTELVNSIQSVNRKYDTNLGFNYTYSDLKHPQRVYFRSDHYPFMRSGIPGVWFFSGFTPDYHTAQDICQHVNYTKSLKVTKLVYLTALDIGNKKELLKLNVNPAVTHRGIQNVTERSLFE